MNDWVSERSASGIKLGGLYAVFAAIAIGVNLGAQWVTNAALPGTYTVIVALLIGTLAGIAVKYALDKRYIFRYRTTSHVHELRTFTVYAFLSIFPTIIFWGFELGSEAVFRSPEARYLGGFAGLVIGYAVKYALDKRFTFIDAATADRAEMGGER